MLNFGGILWGLFHVHCRTWFIPEGLDFWVNHAVYVKKKISSTFNWHCVFLFLLTNELIARYYTLFTNINLLLSAEILFHQNADSKLVLKRLDNIDELFYASWVVVLISGVIYFCLFRKYTPSSFSNVGESCQSSSSSP